MKQPIAIIGAGITGLTVGFYLKKAGIPFTIFEKEDRTGGVINTHYEKGFLYETGPNSGVLSNIEVLSLIDRLHDKVQLETAPATAQKRLIWKNHTWHALPNGLWSAIKTPLFTFSDKLKVLREPWIPKGTNPNESLAKMVQRRLGQSFLDYAIDPFISGIYAGDPNYLVPRFALPKLYQLEQTYGSFIKGAVAKVRQIKSPEEKRINKAIFSFKGGLNELVSALTDEIGKNHIELNQNNIIIEYEKNRFWINKRPFDKVITTINAKTLSKILSFVLPEEIADITRLKYARVVEASIGFNHWQGMDIKAFGGLIPMKEKRNILGVLFMSSIFQNRAPKQGALLTVFLGGTRREELVQLNEKQLFELLKKELTELLNLSDFSPELFHLHYYPVAIAQYGADSEKRLKNIIEIEKKYPGLIIAGSVKDGVGIADRIKQGTHIAQQLINENR